MNVTSILRETEQALTSIKQLGFYKMLFSQKIAFCFTLLFVTTGIVLFSCWAVCKHIIDSGTFGTVVVTFGGITATLAGVYNIVHGINDRAAMQIVANVVTPPAPPVQPAPPAVTTVNVDSTTTNGNTPAETTDPNLAGANANLPPAGIL